MGRAPSTIAMLVRVGVLWVGVIGAAGCSSKSKGGDAKVGTDGTADGDAAQTDATTPPTTLKTCRATCTELKDCTAGGASYAACKAGRCISCEQDDDCSLGWSCDKQRARCKFCEQDSECVGQPFGTGKCNPLSDGPSASGSCTGCDTDADCTEKNQPYCVDGGCHPCRTQQHCAGNLFACHAIQHFCGGCRVDDDCCRAGAVSPCPLRCDVATGECTCSSSSDCGAAFPTSPYKYACDTR